ncbi:MAG: alpha/beta fold hydrolase [Anaerolineae bacterium]
MSGDTRNRDGADRTMVLPDGRCLGYAEYGDRNGEPVFYCHGMPGSRLQRHPDIAAIAGKSARLIVPDRPGYGLSTFQPQRRLLDWPRDLCQLADHLALERFSVVGVSGGGPYALACAFALPERLTGVAVVSSPAPLDRPQTLRPWGQYARWGLRTAALSPGLFYPLLWLLGNPARDPERFVTLGVEHLAARDQSLLGQPDIRSVLIDDTRESVRQGLRGYWWDLVLLARPWGFDPGSITVPVHLWHGDADAIVPCAMGHCLAEAIPACHCRFLPRQGHFLVFDHLGDVFAALHDGT